MFGQTLPMFMRRKVEKVVHGGENQIRKNHLGGIPARGPEALRIRAAKSWRGIRKDAPECWSLSTE